MLIPELYNPQALNRYAYVNNSPINFSDPTGHMREGPLDGTNNGCSDPRYCHLGNPLSKFGGANGDSVVSYTGSNGVIPNNKYSKEKYALVDTFQMIPSFNTTDFHSYGREAERGYDDHSWGGSFNGPINPPVGGANAQYAAVSLAVIVDIGNNFAIGYRPTYYRNNTPYTQSVYIGYTVAYDGIPRNDATRNVTLTGVMIHNSSDHNVTYSARVNNSRGWVEMPSVSAAPGTWANFEVSDDFSISSGMNMNISADNACHGPCITSQNPQLVLGRTNVSISP